FRVDALYRGDSFAVRNRETIGVENQLQCTDDGEEICEVEVTEVGDAEDLAFHRSLAVRDDHAELVAEAFHDDARIHSLGRLHSGDGSRWGTRAEQLEADFADRGARGLRQQLRVVDQFIHAELFDVFQGFGESDDQRDGGRPGGFAALSALELL